jgi:hypothetical protein
MRGFVIVLTMSLSVFACQFDIWKLGMPMKDAVLLAQEKDLPLVKSAGAYVVRKHFDWKYLADYEKYREFVYHASLFGKPARVKLYFTQESKRLYQVIVRWSSFHSDKDEFEKTIYALLDRKYGPRKIGMPSDIGDYVFNKYRYWRCDDTAKIIAKRNAAGIELIYVDQAILNHQKRTRQKKKLQMIISDAPKL